MAARHSDADLIHRLHHRKLRRDKPAAVRFTGGRAGAGRPLPHLIRFDEVRAFFPRRIRRHDRRFRRDRDSLFWRLALSRNPRRLAWLDFRADQHRRLFRESGSGHFYFYVDPLDPAPFSLRPAYAAGLAFLLRNRAREYFYCRSYSGISANSMTKSE